MLVLSHGVNNANLSFCTGKKIRKGEAFSWFPDFFLLLITLSRFDFGPAYREDPVHRLSPSWVPIVPIWRVSPFFY
jgi:hypothetical protein